MLPCPGPSTPPDPGQLLSVSVAPGRRPDRVVVEVIGVVDAYTAPLLEACLDSRTARRGVRELVVDLREVRFLAAAGINVLARAQRRCDMQGARLIIRCGDRRVLRLVRSAGLTSHVLVEPSTRARPQQTPRRSRARRRGRVCLPC